MKKILAAVGIAGAIVGAVATTTATSADAATARNGKCETGEFCLYFNSNEAGSVSDFTTSISDYGAKQPSCYEFKGAGNGKGKCVKNNAASVWNRTSKPVTVYYNSGYAGAKQVIKAGAKANLTSTLKNENAAHHIGTVATPVCSTSGLGDPHSCAQAVTWAKSHEHSGYSSAYYRTCDHLVALAYGFSSSGSTTAYVHWTQIPAKYKHAGATNVPAGGLAFFQSSSAGHVMISIGGGKFVSNDIHGNGSYTVTTIAEIKSKWGQKYLGWAQPWFKANH